MAKGQLRIQIIGDASQFSRTLSKTGSGIGTFGKIATAGFAAVGAGAVYGMTKAIKAYAGFDAKMTQSLAIMGDVSDSMRTEMSDAAREVAKTTTFSAEQAAEAYYFLASAGLDAQQSIKAMPAVAEFAQAGMFDLALATDLLTDAQSALGLSSDDAKTSLENMVRVSDVLVKANTLANASVQQFSEALTNKAGAAAKSVGMDVEEAVAVLAAFADQGVKGAEAGTQFAIVLRDLQTKAIENKDAFAKFGVAVFDSQGELRNMGDIIGDLEGALEGMSDEQVKTTLKMMGFTDKSISAMLALMGTSDAIKDYEKNLRDAGGTTETVAAKQLDTFNAKAGILKDKLIDIALTLGESVMPKLEDYVEGLGRLADRFGEIAKTEGFGAALQDLVQTGLDELNAWIDGGGLAETAGNFIATLVSNMVSKIPDLAEGIIRGLMNSLVPGSGGEASSPWGQIGQGIAEGIVTGLASALTELGDRIIGGLLQIFEGTEYAQDITNLLGFQLAEAARGKEWSVGWAAVLAEEYGMISTEAMLAFTAATQAGFKDVTAPAFKEYITKILTPAGVDALVVMADVHGESYALEVAGAIGRGEMTVTEAIEMAMDAEDVADRQGRAAGEGWVSSTGGFITSSELVPDIETYLAGLPAERIGVNSATGYVGAWALSTPPITTDVETKLRAITADQIGDFKGDQFVRGMDGQLYVLTSKIEGPLRAVDAVGIGGSIGIGMRGGVIAKMAGIGGAITAKVKRELGIRSPSTEFEEIGEQAGAGFEVGIAGNMEPILDIFEELAEAIRAVMQQLVEDVKAMIASIDGAAEKVKDTVEEAKPAAEALGPITQQDLIDAGLGTTGALGTSWWDALTGTDTSATAGQLGPGVVGVESWESIRERTGRGEALGYGTLGGENGVHAVQIDGVSIFIQGQGAQAGEDAANELLRRLGRAGAT